MPVRLHGAKPLHACLFNIAQVLGIVESDAPLNVEYAPHHPLSDEKGYIYKPNVNIMEEMANMISASRSYETNVQVADAAKQMVSRTLMLGQR